MVLAAQFWPAGIGLVGKSASCKDLLKGNFKNLMQGLFGALERAQLQRFDLTTAANPAFDVS